MMFKFLRNSHLTCAQHTKSNSSERMRPSRARKSPKFTISLTFLATLLLVTVSGKLADDVNAAIRQANNASNYSQAVAAGNGLERELKRVTKFINLVQGKGSKHKSRVHLKALLGFRMRIMTAKIRVMQKKRKFMNAKTRQRFNKRTRGNRRVPPRRPTRRSNTSRFNPERKQIETLLKSVKDALVNAARLAPTKRIPAELNSILTNLQKLCPLINAYARARIFTRSPEADAFKGEYKRYVAEHVRCCNLQPPVKSKKEQLVNAANKATDAFVRARGTTKFVHNTGRLIPLFMKMNKDRKAADLPKYVPPHRAAQHGAA